MAQLGIGKLWQGLGTHDMDRAFQNLIASFCNSLNGARNRHGRQNPNAMMSRAVLLELWWLKTSSVSIRTSLIHSSREPVIMVQPIQNWEYDNLVFPLSLRN